jgi:hypothetical protein
MAESIDMPTKHGPRFMPVRSGLAKLFRVGNQRLLRSIVYEEWDDNMQANWLASSNSRSLAGQCLPSSRSLAIAVLALTAGTMNVQAEESLAADETNGGWTFAISPYLWAAGIEGKSGTLPGLPPADVDMSFSDILDDLKFAGMLIVTARKDRFGIGGDLQYVKTSSGIDAAPPIFDGGKLTSETFGLSAWGDYVVFEQGRSNLKVAAGARLWSVDTKLKLSGGLLSGRKIDHDETWVDPMVGVIGRADVVPNVFVQGWGFVGGFGVGSDTMVDLFGGIGYRFSDATSTTLGYRWLKIDYDHDGFLYDVRQQGIAAGLTFRF